MKEDEKEVPEMKEDEKEVPEMKQYHADVLNPFELKQSLTPFQILKVCIMTVFLPVKLLLMLTLLTIAWVVCIVSLPGMPKEEAEGLEPLSGWRRHWIKPFLSRTCRVVFFLCGYLWVPQKGRRASRREAPVLLVMPHSSFMDTALVAVLHSPGMVVKDISAKVPFFGDMIRFTQPLFVSSTDPNSRRKISEEIRKRVQSDKDFEQLMLFPEGGCGNRKALLQFKLGAFSPGVPVQPVFVRYNNNLDTITWTWEGPGAWNQLWLSLTQIRIYCELEFLPVYKPSTMEKQNPRLFANNVQRYVSSWTGCPATHFAVEDAKFLRVARKMSIPPTAPLVKFLRLRDAIGRRDMDPTEELNYLRERNSKITEFRGDSQKMAEYLGLERCPEVLKVFYGAVDQKGNEMLDVRIYASCLCLIRKDLKTRLKLKAAFQAFVSETETEHLSTVLLLWKGLPGHLIGSKNLSNTFDKIESGENDQDSRNFL